MTRLQMDRLCEEFEAPVPSPAGGSAAAAVAAIAASLVVMVGRGSPGWSEGAAAAVSAAALRDRLLALGGEDVEAVAEVLAASRVSPRSRLVDGGSDLGRAMIRASQVPLEIAERAAAVALLAADAATEGKRPMRADADAAATLAAAAAQVAFSIVRENLTRFAPDEPGEEIAQLRAAAHRASELSGVGAQPATSPGEAGRE